MTICFLAPANSAHIVKWSCFFLSRGHEVHVISFTKGDISGATVHFIDTGADSNASDINKLKYLLKAREIKSLVNAISPDVVNAHYATSYGTVAALAGLKNYVLSVWGSDIYDFPRKSLFHRVLLKYSLKKAPYLFSTSKAMADEAARYIRKHFEITPFGVDTGLFSPNKRNRNDNDFVIGTVKAISYKYGIDYLLRAVALVRKEHPDISLKLRIAGKGPNEAVFRSLAENCGISDITTWLGFISQEQAAYEWANFDLAVVYSSSESESFGVSAVEAQACACPVIISDIPGLMEATKPGVTSKVVPRKNERALADALFSLYTDGENRIEMGRRGRQFVIDTYEYEMCFHTIEKRFTEIMYSRE